MFSIFWDISEPSLRNAYPLGELSTYPETVQQEDPAVTWRIPEGCPGLGFETFSVKDSTSTPVASLTYFVGLVGRSQTTRPYNTLGHRTFVDLFLLQYFPNPSP